MDSEDEFERWERQYEYEQDEQEFMPGYEELQSCLRLSMTCSVMVSDQPLEPRILELAALRVGEMEKPPLFKGWRDGEVTPV